MDLARRRFLTTSAKAVAATGACLSLPGCISGASTATPANFSQPPLPYPESALEPMISTQTVRLHYGKHHAGYFKKLNKLATGTDFAGMKLEEVVLASAGDAEQTAIFNNAGQAWNHILYWEQMDQQGEREASGDLATALERDFGSFDLFKTKFIEEAATHFGSGWAWLVVDEDKLAITTTKNADNPLPYGQHALMGVDVWEHAYYYDYQNRRKDHLVAVMDNLIDWSFVGDRLAKAPAA